MTKEIIIIALVIALIYLYYQRKQPTNFLTGIASETNQNFSTFLKEQLNSNNLEELKTKLGEKTLDELIEENEDYETDIDTLTRTKNSLEQDLLAQSNAFQNRLREKDRESKKFKEDLTNEKKRADNIQEKLNSEKQMSKGNIERITKLTEQIQTLEKEKEELSRTKSPIPGEFPPEDLTKTHQEQLRKIYALFDLRAKGMKEIDFSQLYGLLQKVSKTIDLGKIDK